IEHRGIGPKLFDDTDAWAWDERREEHHPAWPPSLGDERQIHPARRMRDADDIRWLLAKGLQRLDECLSMPSRPFASPAQVEGRGENVVTPLFEFLHQPSGPCPLPWMRQYEVILSISA